MKKNTFKLIGLIMMLCVIVAFVAAPAASAQQYGSSTLTTSNVAAGATATIGSAITVTKYDSVALELRAKGSAGSTGVVTATFSKSIDGTNFGSTFTMTATASGTTSVSAVTNISVGAIGYLRLDSLANGDEAKVATSGVYYATKPYPKDK